MTLRKEKALQALLVCRTRAEAAKAAGIGESTLREYMRDPAFFAAYQKAMTGLVKEAAAQAKQSLSPALSTLREITEDVEQGATARIQAARSLLEYGVKLIETADILERLDRLEYGNGGDNDG